MGWISRAQQKRVDRHVAETRQLRERDTVITEQQLREIERAGHRVVRQRHGVIVHWNEPSGSRPTSSYPALGNGRYQRS